MGPLIQPTSVFLCDLRMTVGSKLRTAWVEGDNTSPESRRFSLTSTTSPGDSMASSVVSKVTMRPSRARLMKIVYSGSSLSPLAATAFTSSILRAGPMLVSISSRRWEVSCSSFQGLPLKCGFQVTQLDVELTHSLP